MSMVHKRLLADLKRIDNENDDGITAMPNENNLFVWTATIDGP